MIKQFRTKTTAISKGIICNHLCVYEHQGSYNPNMAIRELIYFVNLIMRMVHEKKINIYGRKKIRIPRPQFVVFYNGEEERSEREFYKLSDLLEEANEEPQIELICEAININPNKNMGLKKKSYVLEGYCIFVEKVRKLRQEGMELENALDQAIKECIEEHVLEDFFRQHGDEVKKMTVLDFTFERRIELEKRDARAEGETIGKSEFVLKLLQELGEISPKLREQILNQQDEATLFRWLKCAAKSKSIADFEKRIINE